MADEPKVEVDAEGWGERDDWAAAPTPPRAPAPQPRPARSLWFVAGGVVLLVALLATLYFRRADDAQQRADDEQQAAHDARKAAENARLIKAKSKPAPVPEPLPKIDPDEALRLMAADADTLNKLGMYRLESTDDIDGAVAALQDAAKLDPKYAPNLALALKRKAEIAAKEQAERDRVSAAGAAGGGPAIALMPQPEM